MINELISRLFKSSRSSGWTLLITVAVVILLSACSNTPVGTSAQILETKIVVRGEGPAEWHFFDFNVPKAGSATLRLSNGARMSAPFEERAKGAKVTLNGEAVVTLKKFLRLIDVLDVPVELQTGTNRLGVRLRADFGKRVSVRIDAPADKVVVTPVFDAVVVGGDPLRAQATVTGLDVPVPGATVQFEVLELGTKVERSDDTGNAGKVTALMTGFAPGDGVLRATVVDTALFDEIPIQVVTTPAITVDQKVSRVTARVGSTSSFAFTVNVLKDDGQTHRVTLAQAITSEPRGVRIETTFPFGGVVAQAPQSIPVNVRITGVTPGRYTLNITAKLADTGESARAELGIRVREPLVLNVPSAVPSALRPTSEPTTVTFRTLVTGTSMPPDALFLDEVTQDGTVVIAEAVAELQDNGQLEDSLRDDGFYAGTLTISSPVESEKYYRLRVPFLGETVTSGIAIFPITELPLKARPSDPDQLVDDPQNQATLFANEAIVAAFPGVSPQRVRTIVEAVGQTLSDNTIRTVGYLPPLDLYLVEIAGDRTAEGVRQAVEAFRAYDEIKEASPNFQGEAADAGSPNEERFPPCEDGTASQCQYYLQTIHADEAWRLLEARGFPTFGSDLVRVAVIDNGIDFENHVDLDGQQASDNDELLGDNSGNGVHGTDVAGLIAAKHNNEGIAGVAPGTRLIPLSVGNIGLWKTMEAANDATHLEAKIINISWAWTWRNIPKGSLDVAICDLLEAERLVVVAAGNLPVGKGCPETQGALTGIKRYPAQYGKDNTCPCGGPDGDPDICDALLVVGAIDVDDDNNGAVDNGDVIATAMGATATEEGQCSNVQPWVDIYAPGEDVVTTQTQPGLSPSLGPANGTSAATALVSGAAAVLWATDPVTLTNQAVADRLRSSGRPLDLDLVDLAVQQRHPLLDGTAPDAREVVGKNPVVLDLFSGLNQALFFDGVDDFVNIPDRDDLDLQNLTLEAWVLIDQSVFSEDNSVRLILSKGGNYTLRVEQGKTEAEVNVIYAHQGVRGVFNCCGLTTIPVGEWTHVAFTYSYNTEMGAVYVNGQRRGSLETNGVSPLSNSGPLILGGFVSEDDQLFLHRGYLDEVRIWNVARREDQIANNFKRQLDLTTDLKELVGYWKFEEAPDGQNVRDSSASENDNNSTLGMNDSADEDDPTRELPPLALPLLEPIFLDF